MVRRAIGYSIFTILSIALYFIVFRYSQNSSKFLNLFSSKIDCQLIAENFKKDGSELTDDYKTLAQNDKFQSLEGTGRGIYYCYCKEKFSYFNSFKKTHELCGEYNTLYMDS